MSLIKDVNYYYYIACLNCFYSDGPQTKQTKKLNRKTRKLGESQNKIQKKTEENVDLTVSFVDSDESNEEATYVPSRDVLTHKIYDFFVDPISHKTRSKTPENSAVPTLIPLDVQSDNSNSSDDESESSDENRDENNNTDALGVGLNEDKDGSQSTVSIRDTLGGGLNKDKDRSQRTVSIRVFVRLGGRILNVPKVITVSRRYGPRSRDRKCSNEQTCVPVLVIVTGRDFIVTAPRSTFQPF